MSDMKTLMEAVTKFSFANPKQKPGDQWRGTDKGTPGNKLVGGESVAYCDSCDQPKKDCSCDLKESLMMEYRHYVEDAPPLVANTTPGGTTTSTPVAAGTAPAAAGTTPAAGAAPAQPATTPAAGQKPQPAQTPQQAAALAMKDKQAMSTNLNQLKTINPDLNVPRVAGAITKDPKQLSAGDAQALDQLGSTLKPALTKPTGVGQIKSLLQRLQQ